VLSNEFDGPNIDNPQAFLLEERNLVGKVHRAGLFLTPATCNDGESKNAICTIEEDDREEKDEENHVTVLHKTIETRFYDIEVTAQDAAGNLGMATCTVNVVPPHHYCGKGGKGRGKGRSSSKFHESSTTTTTTVSPASVVASDASSSKKRPGSRLPGMLSKWLSSSTPTTSNDTVVEADIGSNTTASGGDDEDDALEQIVTADDANHKDVDCQHQFDDLEKLRQRSMQRVVVTQLALEWDPALDDTLVVPPLPPPPLFRGKGKAGKGGRQGCPLDCKSGKGMMSGGRRNKRKH
jgi:hypothetical protein